MSDDVYTIAGTVAEEELANGHCGYYKDKPTKAVTAFFRNQLYRTWGLTANRGWARLLLDRQCLVQIPTPPETIRSIPAPETTTMSRPLSTAT